MCIDDATQLIVDTARLTVVKQCNRETRLTIPSGETVQGSSDSTSSVGLLSQLRSLPGRRGRRRPMPHVLAALGLHRLELRELIRREHATECLYQLLIMLLEGRAHFFWRRS